MAVAWAPTLEDCAVHIPTRPRDTTPGSDVLLGTFTADTTPDAGQAQAVIDAAVRTILSYTGPLDATDRELLDQARTAAEWRAAADIELAYPNRTADVTVYDQLNERAKYELATLLKRLQGLSEGPQAALLPSWSSPDPPPWADRAPDDWTAAYGAWWWGGIDRSVI